MPEKDRDTLSSNGNGYISTVEVGENGDWIDTNPDNKYSTGNNVQYVTGDNTGNCSENKKGSSCVILGGRRTRRKRRKSRLKKRKTKSYKKNNKR